MNGAANLDILPLQDKPVESLKIVSGILRRFNGLVSTHGLQVLAREASQLFKTRAAGSCVLSIVIIVFEASIFHYQDKLSLLITSEGITWTLQQVRQSCTRVASDIMFNFPVNSQDWSKTKYINRFKYLKCRKLVLYSRISVTHRAIKAFTLEPHSIKQSRLLLAISSERPHFLQ